MTRRELIDAILLVSGAEATGRSEVVLEPLERMSTEELRELLISLATTRKWAREQIRENNRESVIALREHNEQIRAGREDH